VILIFLLLICIIPYWKLKEYVVFDPAKFLNSYYSIIATSFLISFLLHFFYSIQEISKSRKYLQANLNTCNSVLINLKTALTNHNVDRDSMINLNRAVKEILITNIKVDSITNEISNFQRSQAIDYIIGKTEKELSGQELSEREIKDVDTQIEILLTSNNKIKTEL